MIRLQDFKIKYNLPETAIRRLIKEGIIKARKEKTIIKVIRYNKPFNFYTWQIMIDEDAWLEIPTFIRNALTKKIINRVKGQKKYIKYENKY